MSNEDVRQIAAKIADQLGEKQHGPRKLVREVVERCGVAFAQEVLKDTEEVMALGGMLTAAADRLRTKGGVFFYLARGRMSDEIRQIIFPPRMIRNRQQASSFAAGEPEFHWADRLNILRPLLDEQGEASTVKITLIGRPGKIEIRKDLVITTMSHSAGAPTFPRGVPALPETPTVYTVYIAAKQWKRVESALQEDPGDVMIVEGMCAYDAELPGIAVYATRATTKFTEAARRDGDNGTASTDDKPAPKANTKAVKSGKVNTPPKAAKKNSPPAVKPSIPESAPENIARKLRELHAAAELYRQKIATIEAKPSGQQFGLEMTQKLLKNVEEEISTLQAQYA